LVYRHGQRRHLVGIEDGQRRAASHQALRNPEMATEASLVQRRGPVVDPLALRAWVQQQQQQPGRVNGKGRWEPARAARDWGTFAHVRPARRGSSQQGVHRQCVCWHDQRAVLCAPSTSAGGRAGAAAKD